MFLFTGNYVNLSRITFRDFLAKSRCTCNFEVSRPNSLIAERSPSTRMISTSNPSICFRASSVNSTSGSSGDGGVWLVFAIFEKIIAVVIAGFFIYINYRGASETGRVGAFFTLGQTLFLVLIGIVGIIKATRDPSLLNNFTPFLPYGWIVPRPSVLKDPAVTAKAAHLKIAGEELLDASKNYFFFLPSLPEYPQCMDIAGNALSNALAGNVDIETGFKDAQKKLEKLFKKAGYIK